MTQQVVPAEQSLLVLSVSPPSKSQELLQTPEMFEQDGGAWVLATQQIWGVWNFPPPIGGHPPRGSGLSLAASQALVFGIHWPDKLAQVSAWALVGLIRKKEPTRSKDKNNFNFMMGLDRCLILTRGLDICLKII